MVLLDDLRPGLRDPEYGRRVARYRARAAENPGRPMVMVVGSSRAAMGVCPAAWEAVREQTSDPMLFNMSLLGSGPVMELMVARRAFADGLRPALVLIEYWPPYYSEDHPSNGRADRFPPLDRPVVRDYFPDAPAFNSMRAPRYPI